ncbi:MAG: L,D-transpeptidase [Alphaproteobacteria bacterium]|nr:L,D-transpeptidase [Alphaproteobacteria bacterium]
MTVNELDSLSMAARISSLCLLTALTTILPAFAAEARPSFSRDSDSFQESGRHHHKSRRHKDEKEVRKEAPKPQGSLIIAISIDKQRMKVYDTNGAFAETQISTGMRGHRTPMGVFSVIQKQRFHRSNIYSDAPMPYMQRITWSGIAMHAGVVPGHPASHGCIRLPASFASKIWTWTRLGARVIVTPGEITPARFSHNLLTSLSTTPQPPASADPAPVSDLKSPAPAATTTPTAPIAAKEAAPSSNHDGYAATEPTAPAEKTASAPAAVATDAAADRNTPPPPTAPTGKMASAAATVATDATADSRTSPTAAAPAEKLASAATTVATDASANAKATPAAVTAPAEKTASATAPVATDAAADRKKTPPPALAAPSSRRNAPIAIFISRKDSKIYVRQNFAPLFNAPVTIAAADQPLGTHVFTAEADPDSPNAPRWSVVSLPLDRYLERKDDDRSTRRHRRHAAPPPPVEKPKVVANTPAEALDRITIPAETLVRINSLFSVSSSLVISDQGINQGETGEGTDFIVRLWR